MTIKAALLDENGVYLRMDELADESYLTDRHLVSIQRCDLPPGEYRWIPDTRNPYGGAFESIAWRAAVEETKRQAAEHEARTQRGVTRRGRNV